MLSIINRSGQKTMQEQHPGVGEWNTFEIEHAFANGYCALLLAGRFSPIFAWLIDIYLLLISGGQ
jgi:hypothetical protein